MDHAHQFWDYILENSNRRFCIGRAEDLERRVSDHNESGFTRGKLPLTNGGT